MITFYSVVTVSYLYDPYLNRETELLGVSEPVRSCLTLDQYLHTVVDIYYINRDLFFYSLVY